MKFAISSFFALALLAFASTQSFGADTLYWDIDGATPGAGTSSTGSLEGANWSINDATGASGPSAYESNSDLVFSAGSDYTGTQSVTVNGTDSVDGFTFNNGTVTLFGANTPNLSIGAGGIAVNSNDGPTTFDSSLGTVTVSASQSWDNNSTKAFNVNSGVTGSGQTLTSDGSGSINLNGVVAGSLNLDAEAGTIALNNTTNTFTGTVSAETGGTISVGHLGSLNGNTVDLNGGSFVMTSYENYNAYSNAIVLGTGGGNIAVQTTSGPDDAVYSGTITGGTGLTLTTGDLLETSNDGNNNVGTLTIDAGSRLLAIGGGIFANNAAVNVDAGILDFANGFTLANPITLTNGSTIASRGGYTTLSNVTFPTTGTIGLGSDDSGGGAIEITSGINTGTGLTLDINGESNNTNATPVILSGVITGSGPLTLSRGQDLGSFLTINNNGNNYSGATTINDLTVQIFNGSGNAFGSSVVTLNNTTLIVGGNYYNYLNSNEFILGDGTNTISSGGNGISSFSGYFEQGTGSVLHIEGYNNTFVGNSNLSDIGTLDVDGGRLFLVGGSGLNLIANNAAVNVNNFPVTSNTPYGPAFLDFATQTTQTLANIITFESGTGLQMRGSGTNITLTGAVLPTSGTFIAGSDDTSSTGSFTITNGDILQGDLTFDIGDSNGSTVPVTISGNITGSGGITQTDTLYGPGIFILQGTNSYSGSTTLDNGGLMEIQGDNSGAGAGYVVNGGTLDLGTNTAKSVKGQLASDATITLASNGTTAAVFELGDGSGAINQTVSSITATGTTSSDEIVGGSSSISTLTVNNATADTFAGVIGGSGSNQNNIAVTKSGAGKLTLSGNNTYTGGTTVTAGKLAVDGTIAGNVLVELNAELGGNGSIGGTISGAGAVGPGNSPGILTASAVDPTAGTSFNFEFSLAGTTPTYATGSNDFLHLTNTSSPFTAALTSGNVINLYFVSAGTYIGGFFADGSTDNLTAALANATFNYYIEDASGSTSYNGINYELTSGSEQVIAEANANFSTGSASGYTEEFTAGAAPEPSTYAMMIGGLALLGFVIRRRQVRA